MNTRRPPLEKKIVKNILETLRSRGAFVVKTYGSPVVTRGVPDITGCYRGYYLAFEVKRDSARKPTKLQLFRIKEIRAAGGHAWVIWSVAQALKGLEIIDEKIAQREGASPGGGYPTKPQNERENPPG